jgi:hypothetical protein
MYRHSYNWRYHLFLLICVLGALAWPILELITHA